MATADEEATSCREIQGLPHALWRLQAVSSTVAKTEHHFEKGDAEAVGLIKEVLLNLARRGRRARQLCEVESMTLTRNHFLVRRAAYVLEQERAEFSAQAKAARVQQLAELDESLTNSRGLTQDCQQHYLAFRLENKAMLEELEVKRPELHKLQRANAEVMLKTEMEVNRLQVLQNRVGKHEAAIHTAQAVIDTTSTKLVEEHFRGNAEKEKLEKKIGKICTELQEQLEKNKDTKSELERLWDQNKEQVVSIRQTNDFITKTQNHEKKLRISTAEKQKTLISLQAGNMFKQKENESLKSAVHRLEKTIAMERARKQEWELPIQEAERAHTEMAENRQRLYNQCSKASQSRRESTKHQQNLQKTLDHSTQKLQAVIGRAKALEMDIDQMKKTTQKLMKGEGESAVLHQRLHDMELRIQVEREKQEAERREKNRALEIMTRMNFAQELQLQIDEIDGSIEETSATISSLQNQLQELQRASNTQEYTYLETRDMLIEDGENLIWNFEDFRRQADLELDKTIYFEAFERSMAKALAEMQWKVEQVISRKGGSNAENELDMPVKLRQRSFAVDREYGLLRRGIQRMIERTKCRVQTIERSKQLEIEDSPSVSDGASTPSENGDLESVWDPLELDEVEWGGRAGREISFTEADASCRRNDTQVQALPRGFRYYEEIEREVSGILGEMQFLLDKLHCHKKNKKQESDSLRLVINYIKASYFDIRRKTTDINQRILIQIEDSCVEKKELEEKFIVTQIKIGKVDEENERIKSTEQRLEKEIEQLQENLQWILKIIPRLQKVLENSDDSWRHEVVKKIGDIPSARLVIQNLEVIESEVQSRMITVGVTGCKVVAELERFKIISVSPPPSDSVENRVPLPRPSLSKPNQERLDKRRFRMKSRTRLGQPHKHKSCISDLGGSSGTSQYRMHRPDKPQNKSVTALAKSDARSKPAVPDMPLVLRGDMGQQRGPRNAREIRRDSLSRLPATTTGTSCMGRRKPQAGLESHASRSRFSKSESFLTASQRSKAAEKSENKDNKKRWMPSIPTHRGTHNCLTDSGDAPRAAVQDKAKRVPELPDEEAFLKSLWQRDRLSKRRERAPGREDSLVSHSNVARLAHGVGFLMSKSHPANSDLETISKAYTDQLFSAYLKECRSHRKPNKKPPSVRR